MTSTTVPVTLAAITLVLLLAARLILIAKQRRSPLDHPGVFFLLICGLLLLVRWPVITYPQAINLDEAQMMAQAMRYCAHPVPWRDVDGTTGGPLNSLFLTLPFLCSAPATWQTARLALWTANCGTLVFLYLALRRFGTQAGCQLALAPTILFYAFALMPDFTHYSSEAVPVLLLAAGMFLLAHEWTSSNRSRIRLFLVGLISGSIPFTKLQAAPLGLFLVVVEIAILLAGRRKLGEPIKACWREMGVLGAGALTVPLLILGWVELNHALNDFWISYVLAAGAYAQEATATGRLSTVWNLFASPSDFRPYFISVVLAGAGFLIVLFKRNPQLIKQVKWPLMALLAYAALTVLCFLTAGKGFLHYALFLIPATGLLPGLALFTATQMLERRSESESMPIQIASRRLTMAAVLVLLPQTLEPVRYVQGFESFYPDRKSPDASAVAAHIRTASRQGDTMSIWGWMPSYYVECGLMPATRDAIGHYVITQSAYRDYFRRRHLADFERSRPAFFIDVVSDGAFVWWNWKRADAHEGFPELAAFVDENYSLWWTIHLTPNGVPLRIYVLNSRMAEMHLTRGNEETAGTTNPPTR